jgi:hypothetical protein
LTINNEELTNELEEFVKANEMIRERLDRKRRVEEMR